MTSGHLLLLCALPTRKVNAVNVKPRREQFTEIDDL